MPRLTLVAKLRLFLFYYPSTAWSSQTVREAIILISRVKGQDYPVTTSNLLLNPAFHRTYRQGLEKRLNL